MKMSQYDTDDLVKSKEYKDAKRIEPDRFECIFTEDTDIIRDYDPRFCVLAIEHGREGLFFESFAGRHNICPSALYSWLNKAEDAKHADKYADFRSSVKISMSACLHFWNSRLMHALNNFFTIGDSIATIRTIIKDLTSTMPKEIRNIQFENFEAPDNPEEAKRRREQAEKEEEYNIQRGIETNNVQASG